MVLSIRFISQSQYTCNLLYVVLFQANIWSNNQTLSVGTVQYKRNDDINTQLVTVIYIYENDVGTMCIYTRSKKDTKLN